LAGLATGLGALPVFLVKKLSNRTLDALLGFSAGVMLSASFFSLLEPALNMGGLLPTVIGFILGVLIIELTDRIIPHVHVVKGAEGIMTKTIKKVWLFVLAIMIHNIPEGLAVGVAYGSGDLSKANAVAIAIGLQNAPEGLATAFALLTIEGYTKLYAFTIALLSGLIEPVFGAIGVSVASISNVIVPYAMSFAAGAMIYVISDEIIPETHSRGYELEASMGLIVGFLVMMILDNIM